MTTTYTIDPWQFAQHWQDGWNSHDLDRIMAHYHAEVVFRSAKAQALVGKGELTG
jgi:ketosteroid isomerase-like protein